MKKTLEIIIQESLEKCLQGFLDPILVNMSGHIPAEIVNTIPRAVSKHISGGLFEVAPVRISGETTGTVYERIFKRISEGIHVKSSGGNLCSFREFYKKLSKNFFKNPLEGFMKKPPEKTLLVFLNRILELISEEWNIFGKNLKGIVGQIYLRIYRVLGS